MRNILIIYPHWPPCNLAGVHRPRLVANYLPLYEWHPIVLTVHPDFYEERLDWDLCKTVSGDVEVIHVRAWKLRRPRLVGDIGLRGFVFLYQRALTIIKDRKIDFIWIPIPSFYTALLGRLLHNRTNTHYGIDYIDPWVRNIKGRKSWRHVVSNFLAKMLEPIAIKKASLITGVAEDYYIPALKRNFNHRQKKTNSIDGIHHLAFPYGFDPQDNMLQPEHVSLPWYSIPDCKALVYAGAFLPHAKLFIQVLFKSIQQLVMEGRWDSNVHLFFLGTGPYQGKTIQGYAEDFGISHLIHEVRDRFSFLEILHYLNHSYAVMIIGSTEKHYSASKVFQGIMCNRPILAVLHRASPAACVLKEVEADRYLVLWNEALSENIFLQQLKDHFYLLVHGDNPWSPNCKLLTDKYSSRESAKALSQGINYVLARSR